MYECGQPRADRAHDVQLLNAKTYTHADGCSQNGNTPLANLTFLPGPPATFPEQSRKKYHGQSAESEQWVLLCVLPQSHHLVSYGIQNIPPRLPVARHTWYPCSRFTSLTLVYTCIYRCSDAVSAKYTHGEATPLIRSQLMQNGNGGLNNRWRQPSSSNGSETSLVS